MTNSEDTPSRKDAYETGKQMLRNEYEAGKLARAGKLQADGDGVFQEHDTWTKETAQAMDLSDAHIVGFKDQERDDISNFEDVARLMDRYQTNLNRLLSRMQQTLIEAISHIETLENHWNRLK